MIVPVVEGKKSDKAAVPILLRRILQERFQNFGVQIGKPIFCPRGKLVKAGELERVLELARRERPGMKAVFVLVDADDNCPVEMNKDLVNRARIAADDKYFRATFAVREFESWFLATLESLRGVCGIRNDVNDHSDPESTSKLRLSSCMDNRTYVEEDDQAPLAAKMRVTGDFDNCRSLKKLMKDVETLVTELEP